MPATDRGKLTDEQTEILLRPLKESRVAHTQGMAYLESYDVIAHLTRIFGFGGWDSEVTAGPDLLFEEYATWQDAKGNDKAGWDVCYKASVRLTVFDHLGRIVTVKEDSATGSATHQPFRADAHDLALKSAVSTAEKRAARKIGDQFGLSLYDKGSLEPTIKRIVGRTVSEPAVPSPPQLGAEEPPPPDAGASEHGGWPPVSELLTQANRAAIFAACRERKMDPHGAVHEALGHPIESINELTREEGHKALTWIRNQPIPATQGAST